MIDVDKIEYDDAVISLPKEAVYAKLTVKVMDNGELETLETEFSPSDIRDAFDLFMKTAMGEYPEFQITEKGRQYLEDLRRNGEL